MKKGQPCSRATRKKISLARMGHPVSKETRKKISLATTGKHSHQPRDEETKRKIGISNTGKVRSAATRQRLHESHMGIRPSEESRRKNSISQSGRVRGTEVRSNMSVAQQIFLGKAPSEVKPNPSTKSYLYDTDLHRFLRHYEYVRLVKSVKARDGKICVKCKRSDVKLNVHHVVPSEIGKKSKLCDALSNLVTICAGCHQQIHKAHSNPGNNVDSWKLFLPFARKYLKKFEYEKYLLDRYLK